MKSIFFALLSLIAQPSMASIITTPARPVIGINASEMTKRICYYQDQAYSEGAVIQVGDYYMVCAAAKEFETNGALMWRQLDKSQQTPEPNKVPTKSYKTH
ncbi:DUF1496 domain-containing protein [Vibrio sp. NH-UV-68]|uniref:DUF1496 domain-containing protein n=1 Tax=unclassified Vibrio TaxID=2614977 RepID=UPI0036F4021F